MECSCQSYPGKQTSQTPANFRLVANTVSPAMRFVLRVFFLKCWGRRFLVVGSCWCCPAGDGCWQGTPGRGKVHPSPVISSTGQLWLLQSVGSQWAEVFPGFGCGNQGSCTALHLPWDLHTMVHLLPTGPSLPDPNLVFLIVTTVISTFFCIADAGTSVLLALQNLTPQTPPVLPSEYLWSVAISALPSP